jgi:hypothetical protein
VQRGPADAPQHPRQAGLEQRLLDRGLINPRHAHDQRENVVADDGELDLSVLRIFILQDSVVQRLRFRLEQLLQLAVFAGQCGQFRIAPSHTTRHFQRLRKLHPLVIGDEAIGQCLLALFQAAGLRLQLFLDRLLQRLELLATFVQQRFFRGQAAPQLLEFNLDLAQFAAKQQGSGDGSQAAAINRRLPPAEDGMVDNGCRGDHHNASCD